MGKEFYKVFGKIDNMGLKILAGVFLVSLFVGAWASFWWECRNAPTIQDEEEDEETPDNAS